MASTIIYSIYKATNTITGKVYIGYTSKDLAHRIREHKNDSKRCGPNSKFYNSAKEHGWDCFIWETIYQSLDKLYCRDVMENYFINQHDSYHNGYNATMGGEGMDTETVSKRNKKLWNDPNSTFNSVEHKNHLKKMVENNCGNYTVTNPQGNIFKIKNLRQFCRENNLDQAAMCAVAKGKRNHYKKWLCCKTQ